MTTRISQGLAAWTFLVIAGAAIGRADPGPTPLSGHRGDFTDVDFLAGRYDGQSFAGAPLVRANMRGASFVGCNFTGAVFAEAEVAGADFSNADLSNARLVGVKDLWLAKLDGARLNDLTGVDLHGSKLTNLNVQGLRAFGANLAGVDFTFSQLPNAHFVRANLSKAIFSRSMVEYADFRMANLSGANLSNARVNLASFDDADLTGATGLDTAEGEWRWSSDTRLPEGLRKSRLFSEPYTLEKLAAENLDATDRDLTQASMAGRDLHGKMLSYSRLPPAMQRMNLSAAKLEKCIGVGANFSETELADADFKGAVLPAADLSQARHVGLADFSEAYLDGASFHGVDAPAIALQGAYLRGANFSGAKLVGARLGRATLQGARLTEADLTGGDLAEADLTDADLTSARLAAVDLSHTFGLSREQLARAQSYDKLRLPERLMPPAPEPAVVSASGTGQTPSLPDSSTWTAPAPAPAGGTASANGPTPQPPRVLDDVPPLDGEFLPPLLSAPLKLVVRQLLLLTLPSLAAIVLIWVVPPLALMLAEPAPSSDSPPRTAPDVLHAESARRTGVTRSLKVTCVISIGIGAVMFYRGTVMPQHEVAASARWSKTPCIIATSEVIREDNGESADTFRPGVRFRYRDPGTRTERLGGKFNFNPTSASDPTLPGAIVAHYPTGTLTYCYVDPEHPETAVLQRSMGERKGAGAIALGLVLAGSIGLFSGLLLPKRAPGVSPDAAMLLKLRAIQHSGSAAGYPPPPARRGPVLYRSTELRQQRFVSSFSVALACATATVTIGWANSLFWGNFVVWLVAGVLAVIAISQFLISFKRLWKLSTPSINIGFARPLEPGTAVELRWAFTGRSSTRIDLLALALIGHEEATYTRGTDTITDRRAMPEEPLLEVPQAGRLGEGKCMVNLSPRHMHTFTSRNNVLRWELRVRCSSGRSTTEDLIPVIIYPTGVTR